MTNCGKRIVTQTNGERGPLGFRDALALMGPLQARSVPREDGPHLPRGRPPTARPHCPAGARPAAVSVPGVRGPRRRLLGCWLQPGTPGHSVGLRQSL